jgi:eukaryotic-like serine/threonine-protein kinase
VQEPTCSRSMLQGQLLEGRYRIGSLLSAGGMGRIFTGVDEASGTPVVIKVPQSDEGGQCTNCSRLAREARSFEAIRGEHLVRFVSAGQLSSGMPFLVMERLEGIDLGALVKGSGALSPGVAVSYARQALLGLADLHAAGLVHRDVKPSNLFLCTRGAEGAHIKVIDLGLAKSTQAKPVEPSLTGDHMLLGSPSYVSPEQMRQLDLDPRTDLWSLGVVLFELLTGTRPFQGATIVDVCAQILTQPTPSLRERMPGIDPGLEAVVQRCMAKDRSDRYASALELWQALSPFDGVAPATTPDLVGARVEGNRTKARAPRRASRHERWQMAFSALLLMVLTTLLASPPRGSTVPEARITHPAGAAA